MIWPAVFLTVLLPIVFAAGEWVKDWTIRESSFDGSVRDAALLAAGLGTCMAQASSVGAFVGVWTFVVVRGLA